MTQTSTARHTTTSLTLPEQVLAAWPLSQWHEVTVLIAVSGGADSVALARALHECRPPGAIGRLVLAHFNHRLRGADSDDDQKFVEKLAGELKAELIAGTAAENLADAHPGQGLEGAAREARYEFLISAATQAGARYIATGHTSDDQAETVLHNVLRGTGLAGLAGIPRFRQLSESATLVRPLLGLCRAEVVGYLQSLDQPYRDDLTNRLEDYTRNRIRLTLLPLLEQEFNPRVREALLRLSGIAGEADQLIRDMVRSKAEEVIRVVDGGIQIELALVERDSESVLQYLLLDAWRTLRWPLQDMSYAKWRELTALARANREATIVLPGNIRAERRGDVLRLTRP